MLDYKIHAENDSMYNTPATFAVYVAGLIFQMAQGQGWRGWYRAGEYCQGGSFCIGLIDVVAAYSNPVALDCRSRRASFRSACTMKPLEKPFLKLADAAGFAASKTTNRWAACVPSIYNAMPRVKGGGAEAMSE